MYTIGTSEAGLYQHADRLIKQYHDTKEPEHLEDVVLNKPYLFYDEMFRNFVADIVSGKYKPRARGFVEPVKERARKTAVAYVEYYRGMGLNIYYDSNKIGKINACTLAGEKVNRAPYTVLDMYKNRRGKDRTAFLRDTNRDGGYFMLQIAHGKAVFILNNFKVPTTEEQIEALEEKLLSLSDAELESLMTQARNYTK